MKKLILALVFSLPVLFLCGQTYKFLYLTDLDAGKVRFVKPDEPATLFNFVLGGLHTPYGIAADVPENQVFVSDTNGRIIRYDLVGTHSDTILDDTNPVLGIPYGLMFHDGKIYWGREGGIGRCNPDGSGAELWLETQLTSPPEMPLCLAYNPDDGKIYFTNDKSSYSGGIWRLNADGSGLEEIVPGTDGGAIVVDTAHNYIFYADRLKGICRNNYDGTDELVIDASYMDAVVWGMAVDPEISRLYWTDKYDDKILQSNLDGTGKTDLVTGVDAHALILVDLSPSAIVNNPVRRILVYPNPVTDVLRFEADAGVEKVVVSNALGRVVMEKETGGFCRASLDVSALPEGLYFLTGYFSSGRVFTSRFLRE
ncbi:MAG: T9SS type A sorting domain-containing protein [Bacteroidales bacterium]|nr:T9SS type A sorting domain-containing protein [Bacteroidales bacterium]